MKYLIFLDIDETLLSRGKIHERTLSALARARENGHKVYINTGRSRSIISDDLLEKIKPDGLVCGIGTYIEIDGKVVFSKCMSEAQLEFLIGFFGESPEKMVLEGDDCTVSIHGLDSRIPKENEIFSFEDMKARFPDIRVNKITFLRTVSQDEIDRLGDDFTVVNHPRYSEIAIRGYTKASGMNFVRDTLKMKRENVIAMGDSANDLDMLSAAGISVAVGNAIDEVKRVVDFVSIPCDEGGVGYAIEKLVFKE